MVRTERPITPERGFLRDDVAIITGSAKGIGRGIAVEFALEGAKVIIADIDKEGSKKTKVIISSLGAKAFTIHTDITSEDDLERLVSETIITHGKIDILVNNAAMVHFDRDIYLEPPEEETMKVFETNYHAHRRLSRKVANSMIEKETSGRIIFITSVHAKLVRMQEHYHASKAALEATMRELAFEYGPKGIRVNAIAPGAINTEENPTSDDLRNDEVKKTILLGRTGFPSEIGRAAVFLASDKWSSYITGTTITVDGGLKDYNWITKRYLQVKNSE